ncbi:G/U mismatch-specific DNA glycosylase [soil metagenome]
MTARPTKVRALATGRPPSQLEAPWKPTKEQVAAAGDLLIPDLLRAGLDVVFCGINPGLYSAAIGHNFGRPGNRFWPALYASGFTPRLFSPFDDHLLPGLGFGMTNIVPRTTASADQLTTEEIRAGGAALRRKMLRYQPRYLAVLGISSYRVAFEREKATGGIQPETVGGTRIWVLPNPSGLNAHYQPDALKQLFEELRAAL